MTYYVMKPIVDTLKDYINDNYDTYLDLIRTASGYRELNRITSVKVGNDYDAKGKMKPFILLDPVSTQIEDEYNGVVQSTVILDIVIAIEGYDSETVTEHAECYADAFVSMFLSDDTLGDEIFHASVKNIEYYPGGTGTIKYILLNVELTVETDRS